MVPYALLALAGLQSGDPVRIDDTLCHPSRVLVQVAKPGVLASLERGGARVLRRMPQIGWAVIDVPGRSAANTRAAAARFPGVKRADFDRAGKIAYTPNDTLYYNQWGVPATKVDLAWDLSRGVANVVVAVLDTGVQVDHPDLAPNVWVNRFEIAGNGVDDDNNGYIDDINGWDFVNEDSNPADDHGHGTLCSGVIGATQDNAMGVSGIAPRARIMGMKVANASGYFYDSDTVPGYLYATDNGARVFSCSFFSDKVSAAERDALKYAVKKGVLPVVAAGNANSVMPYYPAHHEVVLAVAAIDSGLNKAGFSNFGANVDVAAPGVAIQTIALGGGYGSYSGTSLACPVVAGIAALLKSAKPTATGAQLRKAIEDTAVVLNQVPFGEYTNYGLVNAEAAMKAVLQSPAPPRPPRFHYMTRVGTKPSGSLARTRIQGRGFQSPVDVQIKANGSNVAILSRGRDFVEFKTPSGASEIELYVEDGLVATVPQVFSGGYAYPMTEASTQGATVTGGFFDTLKADGASLSCSLRGDSSIFLETVFRKISPKAAMNLWITRQYEGAVGGLETIEVYDWSTWSFPYGSWVLVHSNTVPTTMTGSIYNLPGDARRFVDVDGNIYVRVRTSNDLAAGTALKVDQMLLR